MCLKIVIYFAVFVVASSQNITTKDLPGDLQYMSEWNGFKTEFRKRYKGMAEERNRQLIYINKRKLIDDHNKEYKNGKVSFQMGVNEFTDMTAEEIRRFTGLLPKKQPNSENNDFGLILLKSDVSTFKNILNSPPAAIDWNTLGFVSSVDQQASCGSCYAFTVAAAVESHYAIKNNLTNMVPKLSKQQIVDCSKIYGNAGCDGGYFDSTFSYVVYKGLQSESSYPYTASDVKKCSYASSKVVAKITSYSLLDKNEDAIRIIVGNVGPVAVGIQGDCSSFQLYAGGIYDDPTCGIGGTELNHAVVITGYGTTTLGIKYWIAKNSWGVKWGEKGFFRIARGKGALGIGQESLIPII